MSLGVNACAELWFLVKRDIEEKRSDHAAAFRQATWCLKHQHLGLCNCQEYALHVAASFLNRRYHAHHHPMT